MPTANVVSNHLINRRNCLDGEAIKKVGIYYKGIGC